MIDRSAEFLPHQQPDPTPREVRCEIESRFLVWYFWSVEVVAVHWHRSAVLPIDAQAFLAGEALRMEAKRLGWER